MTIGSHHDSDTPAPVLTAVWTIPDRLDERAVVLSFLSPFDEATFTSRYQHSWQSARTVAVQVRERALQTYLHLCRGVGLTTDDRGRTFRSALRRNGECSDWWYHPVSSKVAATEQRTALDWIVSVMAIDRWASEYRGTTLHLHGAPGLLVSVLRSKYTVVATATTRESWPLRMRWRLVALLMRARFMWRTLRSSRGAPPPVWGTPGKPVVVVGGHRWLRQDGDRIVDTHFNHLDEALHRRGIRTVRHVWFLPAPPTGAARGAYERGEAVALQSLVTPWEIIRELLSFRSLALYLRWSRRAAFRRLFQIDGLTLFPFFRAPLLVGFLQPDIPLCRLGALATERACAAASPAVMICAFEWLWFGRPHYEGARRAPRPVTTVTMQHSANTACAFYHVDPANEFLGMPDGCAVPRASHVFVMGEASVTRFLSAGYAPDDLTLSGATRTDVQALRSAVKLRQATEPSASPRPARVLVIPTSLGVDRDLIEAAYAAAEGLPGLEVRVRRKPGDISSLLVAQWHAARVRFTDGTLVDDLASASLVLFDDSGAACEALACGLPAWQWLQLNHQAPFLGDVACVRQFHTVADLREGFKELARCPAAFLLPASDSERVVERVYGRAPGTEAEQIAGRLCALLELGDGGRASDTARVASGSVRRQPAS